MLPWPGRWRGSVGWRSVAVLVLAQAIHPPEFIGVRVLVTFFPRTGQLEAPVSPGLVPTMRRLQSAQ